MSVNCKDCRHWSPKHSRGFGDYGTCNIELPPWVLGRQKEETFYGHREIRDDRETASYDSCALGQPRQCTHCGSEG